MNSSHSSVNRLFLVVWTFFRSLPITMIVTLIAVLILLALPERFAPVERIVIKASEIAHKSGFAYYVKLDLKDKFPYRYIVKYNDQSRNYTLRLLENGVVLAPSQVGNDVIRNIGSGSSAYVPGGFFMFSASDNSDPRTNGKSYVVFIQAKFSELISRLIIIANFIVIGAIVLITWRSGAPKLREKLGISFIQTPGKLLRETWRCDPLLKQVVFLSIAVICINYWYRPGIVFSDGYIWVPMAEDFFGTIGNSDGKHRPLFGFFAHIIDIFVVNSPVSWIILNYSFFILTGIVSYKLFFLITNDRHQSFFFAIFPITSANIALWLNHTLINVEGFFLMYFSFWMLADYLRTPDSEFAQRRKKLWLYSITYGVLMLGKAQYNIALAILIYAILVDRKRFKEAMGFFLIQLMSVPAWAITLKLFFSSSYSVYEVKRANYLILDHLMNTFGSIDALKMLVSSMSLGAFQTLSDGSGSIIVLGVMLSLGYFLSKKIGGFLIVYFFTTVLFLLATNFMGARHAGDLAIVGYGGMAIAIDVVRRRLLNSPRIFWSGFGVILAIWIWFNLSNASDLNRMII